jgi:multidrug efflux pump subunit AcrA (membrane-fusion protein)
VAYPFSQTLRSIERDSTRLPRVVTLFALVILASWLVWAKLAALTLVAVSRQASIEVEAAAHPIAAPATGRLVRNNMVLGGEVKAGDILIELDADAEERRLDESRQLLSALQPELDALKRQLSQQESITESDTKIAESALHIGLERADDADKASNFANEESRRLGAAEGAVSELDRLRAQAEQQKRLAAKRNSAPVVARRWATPPLSSVAASGTGSTSPSAPLTPARCAQTAACGAGAQTPRSRRCPALMATRRFQRVSGATPTWASEQEKSRPAPCMQMAACAALATASSVSSAMARCWSPRR